MSGEHQENARECPFSFITLHVNHDVKVVDVPNVLAIASSYSRHAGADRHLRSADCTYITKYAGFGVT